MNKGKVLVVDDEASIRQIVEARLKMAGFEVTTACDGAEAMESYYEVHPDLIVLDIMMPRMDGLQVCREIRKKDTTPIIMLTAKGDIADRINALEMGADDYIIKPFSPRELEARIKAVLRRTYVKPAKPALIEVDEISIDLMRRHVLKNGERVKLTEMEFSLLELLALNPGKPFSRNDILQQVWGYRLNQYSDTRVVDVHVSRLRSKLEKDVSDPELILTARGTGYMFQHYNLNELSEDESL
ncbi:DNA-binding response regulator [bacterium (Candidatus Blackallbacteria) CG17_big_fil_post_rev_8_21_14_2_50_48_46]|uniref:Probable transcriptional regulator ycf27 n=1 Tax=bacterium (Candidatus Blackallbacteria) CG17_big_fil_post_rev_8_21_14_2_50_48_46 TaxID=2014261 RepID=A0A2M7G3V5_9BACT|nr:MAG: DNA-binding response regulator [bacterium (Candidatus Blackallbacteria) CG18_big_fil_WC_8_21_14_2_50_49_26]PIW16545.1 MAG: DNA-binding response regulator [bacterium (Candidatus Blackallbacteria) CG17_big_fil_post_rev_8_21_14_2_50_48_46]PIW46053.1 MAG: DNA-binding response regulator [bacterium (Candidatus Blackallbacteria) CG13_big_fil_rev_8_21_14_2_50_49_14]